MRHPAGLAARMVASPSGVRAQFFDRAARSTTRSRSDTRSADVHAENVGVGEQFFGDHVVLPGGACEFQFEDAVLGMVEHVRRKDLDAAGAQQKLQLSVREAGFCADGTAQYPACAAEAVLD